MMQFIKGASILGFQRFFDSAEKNLDIQEKFQTHLNDHGISYGTREEYEFRFGVFKEKDSEIDFWNKIQNSYRLGHNKFSTWTLEELKSITTLKMDMAGDLNATEVAHFDDSNLGVGVDWRT